MINILTRIKNILKYVLGSKNTRFKIKSQYFKLIGIRRKGLQYKQFKLFKNPVKFKQRPKTTIIL